MTKLKFLQTILGVLCLAVPACAQVAVGTLSSNVNATTLTLPYTQNSNGYLPSGTVAIDNERMIVCSATTTSVTVCGGGRGANSTIAVSHLSGATLYTGTSVLSSNTSSGASAAIACVATPGNTTGTYRQQCQTSAGALYACNNAAGCAVASDWIAQGGVGTVVCGGLGDASAIQTALNSSGSVVLVGSCAISTNLVIYSNTRLDATKATITLPSTSGEFLENRSFASVQRSVSDAVISLSTPTTLTSASASFTSADVGRSIVVAGAGAQGGANGTTPIRLCALIKTVTNGTTVTLSVAASTAVSGAAASIYTRDANIEILGGTWNILGGAGRGGNFRANAMMLRRVDHLYIHDLTVNTTYGQYGVYPGDVTDLKVEHVNLNTVADGLHIEGPASQVVVRDVTGNTGDDSIALSLVDAPAYFDDVTGSISNVLIDGVSSTSPFHNVNIYGGPSESFANVTVRNVANPGTTGSVALMDQSDGMTYGYYTPLTIKGLLIDGLENTTLILNALHGQDVVVRNVTSTLDAYNNENLVQVGLSWDSVTLDGVYGNGSSATNGMLLNLNGAMVGKLMASRLSELISGTGSAGLISFIGSTVTAMQLRDVVEIYSSSTGAPNPFNFYSGTITNALLDGVTLTSTTGSALYDFSFSATIGNFMMMNSQMTNGNAFTFNSGTSISNMQLSGVNATVGQTFTVNSGATLGPVVISNSAFDSSSGSNRFGNFQNTSDDVSLTNVVIKTQQPSIFVGATTTLAIRGAGLNLTSTFGSFQAGAGAVVNITNPDYPVDVSVTGIAKANGNQAFNTNAGLSCGAGRVISNGSNWKNIYTGSTY